MSVPIFDKLTRIMLENFTIATFSPHEGGTFRIHFGDDDSIETVMTEVKSLRQGSETTGDTDERQPFSLIFRGPLEPLLTQRIYRLEHDELGTFELFLVPIGPDREGMRYEAIFT